MSKDEIKENDTAFYGKIKNAANVTLTVMIAVLVVFLGYIMICSARGRAVNVFGRYVLTVVTGSMEPSLHVGDYIIVSRTAADKLAEDDIISFYSEEDDIKGRIVTHRIVGRNSDGCFITRGDANNINDYKPVRPDQILGRYEKKSRFFMWLNSFADRRKLLMTAVIIPMALIALYEVRTISKLRSRILGKKEQLDENMEKRMREAIDLEKERLAREGLDAETLLSPAPSDDTSSKDTPEREVDVIEPGNDNEEKDV